LSNCPTHKGGVYLFPQTHKIETKRTIKITNPKNNIKKVKKKREKRKLSRKIEINKNFKNYRSKSNK
jgi:hypothetical protein